MKSRIIKADSEQQILTAVVHQADVQDEQGDVISAEDLYAAVCRFGQRPTAGLQHGQEDAIPPGLLNILSSFMTREAHDGLPARAWILTVKVAKTPAGRIVWARVKAGQAGQDHVTIDGQTYSALTGLSMAGTGRRKAVA